MSGDSSSGFWRVAAKLSQEQDQIIALIRGEYHRLVADDQRLLREWVNRLVSVPEYPAGKPIGPSVAVHIFVPSFVSDDASERVEVFPSTLAAAIAAGDRGEKYVHKKLKF